MLYGEMSSLLQYVLPIKNAKSVSKEELAGSNVILIGKSCSNSFIEECQSRSLIQIPKESEGYSIYVGERISYAEILWTPNAVTSKMISMVSEYPCVSFSNL
jgi:hypothetical protein